MAKIKGIVEKENPYGIDRFTSNGYGIKSVYVPAENKAAAREINESFKKAKQSKKK